MFSLPEHTIAFEGLKEKTHDFEYLVNQPFFDLIENEQMNAGKLDVKVALDKRANMLVAELYLSGVVESTCDRCSESLTVPVEGELRQIFKTSAREEYDNEEVIIIPSNEHELNLSNSIYECLMLSFPQRKVHELDACNPEVIKALALGKETQDRSDPRWNALRDLAG